MINKYLCLLAVLLLAMASCSTENDIASDNPVPMNFTCATVPQSRATTYGEFTGDNFGVVATSYTGSYSNTAGVVHMNNVEVSYSDGECSVDGIYYWPKDIPVHFAAYAPYSATPTSANGMNISLPQKPYQGYTFSGKVDGETNWMFANEQYGKLDDFTNGSVPMNFNHTLTQVKFKAALAPGSDAKYKLNIEGLTLRNVRRTGNITFKHNGKSDYTQVNPDVDANQWNTENMLWTISKEFPVDSEYDANYLGDYTVVSEDGITGIYTTLTEINDCLYLMPQQLYDDTESEFPQLLEVTYSITTDGETDDETDDPVTSTIPLKLDEIEKWTVNKSLVYSLIMTPTREVQLSVSVQPWESVEFTNEFSSTVAMAEGGLLSWTNGFLEDNKTLNILTVDPDVVNKKAEFTFRIGNPLGAMWYAMLRGKKGNSSAFKFEAVENASITDGVALGAVGKTVKLRVVAVDPHPTETNEAELIFVVICNGNILSADIVVGANKPNYTIRQNANI